jgi:hypothetical protein
VIEFSAVFMLVPTIVKREENGCPIVVSAAWGLSPNSHASKITFIYLRGPGGGGCWTWLKNTSASL